MIKLYLSYTQKYIPQQDYILFNQQEQNISNLDDYIDNGELSELYVDHCLSKFQIEDFDKILNNWISKLRKGSIITISDVDARLISKDFLKNLITIIDFSNYIRHNQSSTTIYELESFLRNKHLKILEKTINNYMFTIKAEKQ